MISAFALQQPNRVAELTELVGMPSPTDDTCSHALNVVAAVLLGPIAIMLSLGLTTGMRSFGRAAFCRCTTNVSTIHLSSLTQTFAAICLLSLQLDCMTTRNVSS